MPTPDPKPATSLVKIYNAPFLLGLHGDTSKLPIAVAFLSNGEADVAFADGTHVRQKPVEK